MAIWKLSAIPKSTYELIRSGRKTVEVRSPDPSDPSKHYGDMKPGDIVHFFCMEDGTSFSRHVKAVRCYKSPEELLKHEFMERVQPGMDATHYASYICRFPGYSERIPKHGLVAIELL